MKIIGALSRSQTLGAVYFCKIEQNDDLTSINGLNLFSASDVCNAVFAAITVDNILHTVTRQNDLKKIKEGTLIGMVCKNGLVFTKDEDIEFYLMSIWKSYIDNNHSGKEQS